MTGICGGVDGSVIPGPQVRGTGGTLFGQVRAGCDPTHDAIVLRHGWAHGVVVVRVKGNGKGNRRSLGFARDDNFLGLALCSGGQSVR